jgi:hypothetical protein
MVTGLSFRLLLHEVLPATRLVRHQRAPLYFQVQQFRADMFWQQRPQRAERLFLLCGWQGQWPSRRLSNSTFPNTVRTVMS